MRCLRYQQRSEQKADDKRDQQDARNRRVIARIATILMGASLVFTSSTSAHNINLQAAKLRADSYARKVIKESSDYV